ncbi:hypothetical protein PH210_06100 [Paenibacillus sp. BSR1-1]|uniref:hypothetical protein n=1 Tax=Paenibacillus sp. BSR1-1 TaxID=3020845 RepID=UPI0025B0129C|nr:hypothetical protein [Paenibacillus sp. BSR1-1]MDN3015777.1 hypothetical protein [Paenibacillus sp. BSR1-1]
MLDDFREFLNVNQLNNFVLYAFTENGDHFNEEAIDKTLSLIKEYEQNGDKLFDNSVDFNDLAFIEDFNKTLINVSNAIENAKILGYKKI